VFTLEITKPELLAQLEEVRQAGGYSDFEQVVALLLTKASALDAIVAEQNEDDPPASGAIAPLAEDPAVQDPRTPLDRLVAFDEAAARVHLESLGTLPAGYTVEPTGRKDPGGAWIEFNVYAPEPAGE